MTFIKSSQYDTYWRFAAERQQIFFRKTTNPHASLTTDPILQCYRFTNAFRIADRVSQYLLRHVIYSPNAPTGTENTFLRIFLFKIFNKVSTWEQLQNRFKSVSTNTFRPDRYSAFLTELIQNKNKIFSPAYIMPSGCSAFTCRQKHVNFINLLDSMLSDRLPDKIAAAESMQQVFLKIRSYPMMGDFLSYQLAIDLNYSDIINFSENDFVVPGPGARRGITKCIADKKGKSDAQIIRWMVDNQESEFSRLGLNFEGFLGRRLHLIDCQNLFCEVDKYLRVHSPEVTIRGKQARIKQRYRPDSTPIAYMLPPKWCSQSDHTQHG